LAKYLEIRPLFLSPARPINVEWNSKPYFGVLLRVLSALIYRINRNIRKETLQTEGILKTKYRQKEMKKGGKGMMKEMEEEKTILIIKEMLQIRNEANTTGNKLR